MLDRIAGSWLGIVRTKSMPTSLGLCRLIRTPRLCALATALSLAAILQAHAQATTPCLQALSDQKANAQPEAPKEPSGPNWFSRNADKIVGGLGAIGGAMAGKALCKGSNRTTCMVGGAIGGAFLGSQLGKMLSDADKKRYQEASYKVALTGRPQSLTLEKGCMVVEPTSNETLEDRQIELAFGPGVATPQRLRAVAEPYVHPTSTSVGAEPSTGKGLVKVGANVPSFVMGSTDSGKYLLLGREDPDQGFVGAGYVEAKGWVASPDSTPTSVDTAGGRPTLAKVGVEIPCRQISSSIRVESSNKTETYPGKVCRLPNGISEAQ